MDACIKSSTSQEDILLNVHEIKKNGCMSNLLVSILTSKCTRSKTVIISQKDMRSFRSFHELTTNSPFLKVIHTNSNKLALNGFIIIVNKNQKPISFTDYTKMNTYVKLTALECWMAFALSWNISLFSMCVASEINLHYCAIVAKNATICNKPCTAHGVQRMGIDERRLASISPFTMMKFAHRFPNIRRSKLTRTLKELENANMINISKIMHCNIIISNFEHPLFSKYSSILSKFTQALYDVDTLERTARVIRHVHQVTHKIKYLEI